MPKTKTRPALTVDHDSDGGLTIHDPQSDLVVSIITTHPNASGPRGLYVEVYDYRGRNVIGQDVPGDNEPIATRIRHHLTTAYYGRADESGIEE